MGACAAVAVAQDLDISVQRLSEEFFATGEKQQEGISEPCSHFQEFFDLQAKHAGEQMPDMTDMFAMLKDPALMQKKQDEAQKKQVEFEADLKLILEKCFDHYDVNKTQSLGPKACGDLFSHYIDKQSRFLVDMQEKMEKETMTGGADMAQRMLGPMPPLMGGMDHEEEKKEALAKMDKHYERVRKQMEERVSEYRADKARRDAATLEVLDVNGDGKLQKSEIVEGLLPSTAKNSALLRALGINPESMPKADHSEILGLGRHRRNGPRGKPTDSENLGLDRKGPRGKPDGSPDDCKQQ